MAKNETKHKSKYTAPKDMAKSLKQEVRSDLKDYIKELVKDCMWEFSGELNAGPRKDDKWSDDKTYPFVHNHDHKDGDNSPQVPNRKDADTAYPIKMMQDGDTKMSAHAKKAFEKNIEKDAEDYLETMSQRNTDKKLKENIKKLSESQKEKLVRMYVRNKIVKVLQEQTTPPAEEPAPADTETEIPATPDTAAPDTAAPDTAAPDAAAPTDAAPTDAAPVAEPAAEPVADPAAAEPDVEVDPKQAEEEKLQLITKSPELFSDYLELKKVDMNILALVKAGMKPLLKSLASIDDKEQKQAQRMAIKAIKNLKKDFGPKLKDQDSEKEPKA